MQNPLRQGNQTLHRATFPGQLFHAEQLDRAHIRAGVDAPLPHGRLADLVVVWIDANSRANGIEEGLVALARPCATGQGCRRRIGGVPHRPYDGKKSRTSNPPRPNRWKVYRKRPIVRADVVGGAIQAALPPRRMPSLRQSVQHRAITPQSPRNRRARSPRCHQDRDMQADSGSQRCPSPRGRRHEPPQAGHRSRLGGEYGGPRHRRSARSARAAATRQGRPRSGRATERRHPIRMLRARPRCPQHSKDRHTVHRCDSGM